MLKKNTSNHKLKILTYPAQTLIKKADKLEFPLDVNTKDLIKKMWATVKRQGIGLAAPQVGVGKQICIIKLSEDEALAKDFKQADFLMINPRITFYSKIANEMVEGCLSFPGEFYKIVRPANIIVEFFDEQGKKNTLRAKSWLSRVIQHEVDHLNGNLFINQGGTKLELEDIKNQE